jgi:hypothetical protein
MYTATVQGEHGQCSVRVSDAPGTERVAPDALALLGDGVPRTRGTLVAALADRHAKDDVRRTLMRLAVLEQLVEKGGRCTLLGPEPR